MTTRTLVTAAALLAVGPAASILTAQSDKPAIGTFGVDTAQMDRSIKPGDDFFRYVNGTWLATVPIPADRARFGMFDALRDKAEADVHALVESLAKTPQPAGSVRQKVGDLYASFMDQARVEARGIEPLKGDLAAIAAAATKADLVRLMSRPDYAAPFGFGISADPADPTRYVVTVTQAGLGMPSRDYYLSPGPKFDGYRAAYQTYVTRLLELLGDKTPAESAAAVIALETKLANVHWAPERRRNVKDTNNPADRAGLATMVPAIDWPAALEASGLGAAQRFVVRETTAVRDGAALLDTEPVAGLAGLPGLPPGRQLRRVPAAGLRRRQLRLRQQGPPRHRGAARSLEARHGAARRADRRGRRRALRRQALPARPQGGDGRARRQPARRHGRAAEDAVVDGRRDAGPGAEEAGDLRSAHRLPVGVARLLRLPRRPGHALRERPQRPAVRVAAPRRPPEPAGRPQRVADERRRPSTPPTARSPTRSPSRPESCSRRSSTRRPIRR